MGPGSLSLTKDHSYKFGSVIPRRANDAAWPLGLLSKENSCIKTVDDVENGARMNRN